MPRTKYTDEQLKESKKLRNKKYYQEIKIVACPVVYVISGLPDDMYYVGVSRKYERRQKAHFTRFGDVTIKPVIYFKQDLEICDLNVFESLVMKTCYGYHKCLNKTNVGGFTYQSGIDWTKQKIQELLHYVSDESIDFVKECLKKIDDEERGLNV